MKTIKYNPLAGTNINHACNEAVKIAKRGDCMVEFDFNGVQLRASAENNPTAIADSFMLEINDRAEAYRTSPEGMAEAARRESEIAQNNNLAQKLLSELPAMLVAGTLNDVINWLKQFVPIADDIGTKFDAKELGKAFESAGYKNNEGVGESPEWFNTRERMGRYIIGQVINCLSIGMPPHPMTITFIKKYQALK